MARLMGPTAVATASFGVVQAKPQRTTASWARFTTASRARRRSFGVIRRGVAREHWTGYIIVINMTIFTSYQHPSTGTTDRA